MGEELPRKSQISNFTALAQIKTQFFTDQPKLQNQTSDVNKIDMNVPLGNGNHLMQKFHAKTLFTRAVFNLILIGRFFFGSP